MSFLRVSRLVTIERHIAEEQEFHPSATGEYSRLLRDLTLALRIIARDVRRAGLNDVLGITDSMNVHGETVKKLDEFANEVIFRAMDHGGHLCVMASEESEGIIKIPDEYAKGKYVLLFDPLDGSSNIDVNTTIGTIFSIYRRLDPQSTEEEDEERYQTVYAKDEGSVAAPTAGLHFTDKVFDELKNKSIRIEELTLHVGLGTFKPFDAEEVDEFSMHPEKIIVRKEVIESCIAFFSQEHRGACIAVGTTSCRTMESLYWFGVGLCNPEFPAWKTGRFSLGQWDAYALFEHAMSPKESFRAILHWMNEHAVKVIEGQTQLMIVPGYTWGMIEGLITNFHQPESTLLFLVSSFLGIERWKKAYQSALDNEYRFLSYGDSSLLWR